MNNYMTLELLVNTVKDESNLFMYDINKEKIGIFMVKDLKRYDIVSSEWKVNNIEVGYNECLVVSIERL